MILNILGEESTKVTILSGPFRGASMILNPAHSKRKILGIYEHILNPWLAKVIPQTQVLWDVGANDGYFTYGCAHAMGKHHAPANLTCRVIAFEPLLDSQPNLCLPADWSQYAHRSFEFIPRFVGADISETMTTLDAEYAKHQSTHHQQALVKVDVEGAEVDVLSAASSLLQAPHHWVVEVHGDHLLEPVLRYFAAAQRQTQVIPYRPHWLLGPEARTIKTSWVVTQP